MSDAAPTLDELESALGSKNESAADTVRAVWDEMRDSADEGDRTRPGSEPKAQESQPEEPSGDERQRDEKGRFVARDGTSSDDNAAEGPEAGEGDDGESSALSAEENDKETPSEGGDDELEPPHDWKADEQEAFRALPKESRKFVMDRIGAAEHVYNQAAQAVQHYRNLEELLQPYRDGWYRSGVDEVGAVRQLLALSDYANAKPHEFAQAFVRDRGLKPDQVFPQLAQRPDGDQDYADPEIAGLRQQNRELQERLDRIESGVTSQYEQQQTAQQQELVNQVNQFRDETDERGRPKHPYFNEVRGLMQSLIRSEQASDLQNAYDMAVHAHPEVRAKIAAAQRRADEQERARKAREKAEAARQAGTSISGTPGDRSRVEPTGDLREDLRREFAARGAL
jgi:hypothetical protein